MPKHTEAEQGRMKQHGNDYKLNLGGTVFYCKDENCFICSNNSGDIFWDYTNGPYMCSGCDKVDWDEKKDYEPCEHFEYYGGGLIE